MTTVKLGDKCSVPGKLSPLIKPYGVCVGFAANGSPMFVHNVAEGVVLAAEHGFAQGRVITIEQRALSGHESVVAQRALALVGRKYDLFTFNCEHAANLAANGRAESKQVQRGVVAASVGGLLLWLANENGTSVDRSGYRRNGGGRFASRRWW
jgi:hypothetical protein